LIRHKSTGSPDELAERLGMSRSSLFELIAYLKEEMNAPIIYDRDRVSYVYSYTPKFNLGFEPYRSKSAKMNDGDKREEKD
jgi:transcription initiation factor IIE alpha subunit